MKISYTVDPSTTGDNTAEQNVLYAAAVKSAIEDEYPDADIGVDVADDAVLTPAWCDDDQYGEIAENVGRIANRVWGLSDY